MAVNLQNQLELGPVQVFFGVAGAEEDLGFTQGGVDINFDETRQPLVADQAGTSPLDAVQTGLGVEVTVPMAELLLSNLEKAFVGSDLVIDSGDPTKFKLVVQNAVGLQMVKDGEAQSLLLKRFVSGAVSTDPQDFIRFLQAAPSVTGTLSYDAETQRVLEVTFTVFPQKNSAGKLVYFIMGDETAAS